MKSVLLAIALLALFFASCTSGGDDGTPSSSGSQGDAGDFENPGQIADVEAQGKIYMVEKRDSKGNLILTEETMLLIGAMKNGQIILDLPKTVDSRFLTKIDNAPSGLKVEPLGIEALFYSDPFRLIDDSGNHIGNIWYAKTNSNGDEDHLISYCYFSEDVKISGWEGTGEGEGTATEYEINAKKGWNKIYILRNRTSESGFVTTDLSKVPGGLEWVLKKVSHEDYLNGTNYNISEKEDCNGIEYNPKIKFCSEGILKDKEEFTDSRDGKKYKYIEIGTQTWMAENLNYEIAESKCYDNDPANCEKCGRMYDWFTSTTKEICPEGWRLPDNDDWNALEKTVGGSTKASTMLKTKSGWKLCNSAGDKCTDDYGFSALACGSVAHMNNRYYFTYGPIGSVGSFWSLTESSSYEYWAYDYSPGYLNFDGDKQSLRSVRCIKK